MITIYTFNKSEESWVPHEGETALEVVASTGRQEAVMAYVRYLSPDNTANVSIGLAVAERLIDAERFYQVSQWVGNELKEITIDVRKQGEYRFPIPISDNEDLLKMTITSDVAVDMDVYLLPADTRL